MALKTYIGARYAPKFSGAWNKANEYSALEVVYANNQSYVSRKTVPANTEITNTEYWIKSSDWNAQVAQYNANVEQYNANVEQYNTNVEQYQQSISSFYADTMHSYDTKEDMVNDETLKLGETLLTCGNATVGDGGGGFWQVVGETSANAVALKNGKFALRVQLEPYRFNVYSTALGTQVPSGAVEGDYVILTSATKITLGSLKYELPASTIVQLTKKDTLMPIGLYYPVSDASLLANVISLPVNHYNYDSNNDSTITTVVLPNGATALVDGGWNLPPTTARNNFTILKQTNSNIIVTLPAGTNSIQTAQYDYSDGDVSLSRTVMLGGSSVDSGEYTIHPYGGATMFVNISGIANEVYLVKSHETQDIYLTVNTNSTVSVPIWIKPDSNVHLITNLEITNSSESSVTVTFKSDSEHSYKNVTSTINKKITINGNSTVHVRQDWYYLSNQLGSYGYYYPLTTLHS